MDSHSNDVCSNKYEQNEKVLPLAARDSKWVGLNITEENKEKPLYSLFPTLKNKFEKCPIKSRVDIIKLLVGEKPVQLQRKESNKISKTNLQSLEEIPNEEVDKAKQLFQ